MTFNSPPEGDLMLERKLQKARAVLGVPVEATRADIKTAFTTLIKRYHPDVNDVEHANLIADTNPFPTFAAMRKAKDTLINNLPEGIS